MIPSILSNLKWQYGNLCVEDKKNNTQQYYITHLNVCLECNHSIMTDIQKLHCDVKSKIFE